MAWVRLTKKIHRAKVAAAEPSLEVLSKVETGDHGCFSLSGVFFSSDLMRGASLMSNHWPLTNDFAYRVFGSPGAAGSKADAAVLFFSFFFFF